MIVLDTDIISELVKPEPLAAAVARANAQPIAAIARARGAGVIATRSTQDFDGCGVALVNPWLPEAIIGGPPA